MATPRLVTVDEFTQSPYAQLIESNPDLEPEDVLAKAEAAIESRLGRTVSAASYTERFRADGQTIWVRHRPIITITALKRRWRLSDGWTLLDTNLIEVESGPGYVTSTVEPIKGYQVEIEYSAGYAVIPEDIKEAVIM